MEGTISVFLLMTVMNLGFFAKLSPRNPQRAISCIEIIYHSYKCTVLKPYQQCKYKKEMKMVCCKSGCCHELEPPASLCLVKNKVDSQLDKIFSLQRSGNEDGSKACFFLPVIMRDPLHQLCLGQTSLKVQHLFHPSEKASWTVQACCRNRKMSLLRPFPSASWSQKSIFLPVNVVMSLVGQPWCCWVCIPQYATAVVWRTHNLFTSGCHGKRFTTRQNRSIYGNPWVRRGCRASSNWSPALWTEAHRQCPARRVKYQFMAAHTVRLVLAPRKHFWGWKKPVVISYHKNIQLSL